MKKMVIVKAEVPANVKEEATNILNRLGIDMSTYINMALNQLIIQKKIPFAIKSKESSYTDEDKINEVVATLKVEGLELDNNDLNMLQEIKNGNLSTDEARKIILEKV